jgi:glycosyltransferase involved in cell wall biosynthesis
VIPQWPASPPPVVGPDELPAQPGRTPIKVLHVITRFTDGAGGNTLVSMLGADTGRYEMWIAGSDIGPLWARAEAAGIRTVKLEDFPATLDVRADARILVRLVRLMRRERFVIVHTHSSVAGFLGRLAARLSGTPVVIHTLHGFSFHDHMSPRRRWAYITLERIVRPLTHGFIAVAPAVAREAIEERIAGGGEAMSVVPSSVELDQIPRGADDLVRRELGIGWETPIVGTVGRLDFQKAPLDFVRMAALVAVTHPQTRFVMVGEGELEGDVDAEAERLGVTIERLGFREDAARLAAGFDVFVIASLYEGLGRALTEALASGRPVVATAVNGVVDLVVPGSTGLLSPPADPEALARNVAWMLEHPDDGARMGAAGSEWVRRLFAPELMCTMIEAVYARRLGLGPPGLSGEGAPGQRGPAARPRPADSASRGRGVGAWP